MWHAHQASMNTCPQVSLLIKDEDSAKMAPYGVLSDGHVYGLFVPLPQPVLINIRRKQTFHKKRVLAKFCFSLLCSSGFTHGTKAP